MCAFYIDRLTALFFTGIPATPIAAVLSESVASEQRGHITLPPNDIELVDLTNPATLTQDALWYAVNPSYDWLSALGRSASVLLFFFCS